MSRVAAIVGPSAEDKQIAKINNQIKNGKCDGFDQTKKNLELSYFVEITH